MRKESFASGEFYHIYNRGVDKRNVFLSKEDYDRFLQSMEEFNAIEPIGSIYENSFVKDQLGSRTSKKRFLVKFVAYCINPNHYHFLLQQVAEKGIQKFMQRLGTGYTNYFNNKHRRNGVLFQGKFKGIHIASNEYLLHLSAYINLNNRVHKLGSPASKSSWEEYIKKKEGICEKSVVLDQFDSSSEYKNFAEDALESIVARKQLYKEL